nr:alpha-1,2-fucosyltransferase [uncultured Desulfobacter sp.]
MIVKITGGLGNQMFQYACGLVTAIRSGADLRLDIRGYTECEMHNGFELTTLFDIDTPSATTSEIRCLIGWRDTRLGRYLLLARRLNFIEGKHYFLEKSLRYNDKILSLTEDIYLYGCWQSELYFKKQTPLIRKLFEFKLPLSEQNMEIAHQIQKIPNSVSLHIRRGDYVDNTSINKNHGVCPNLYYEMAMQCIDKHIGSAVYFIFSDDPEWVKNNFKIGGTHFFIDWNSGSESYNDMRLMSMCKHNILANSSFSWWGAWLNKNEDKIVIAPKKWFQNPDWDSTDHIPMDWIRI